MYRFRNSFLRLLSEGHLSWVFIVPSAMLLALFGLPLFALFVRSMGDGFFVYAFSAQAFQALRLSLITSTITTIAAVLFGTPLAYVLARWKFRLKSWIELFI